MNRALIIVITTAALVGLIVGLVAPLVASKIWPPLTTLATRSPQGTGETMGRTERVPLATVSAKAEEIVEKFDCACGSCQIPLKDCTCDMPRGSVEMKRFIEEKIKEGKSKQQVVQLVKKRYGI